MKPVTQLRTQTLKSSLPIISSTVAPQVASFQVQQPQVQSIQVQPQVHTIQVQQPQVHTIVQQPQTVQVQQRVAHDQVGVAILRQVQDVQADGSYAFA